mmetsp:Transcript_6465/g.9714  ORF Transcript_6465/g.9714 Transcript_6465/m.9714 type:complete len:147 (-) Transcript_6465:7-447(-)|eukprot:CAMPEP_0171472796 /NCGR_PEP_ID=MMETSP0946-20130122/1480_1 /TAXON_ID=109269 /ORGANISM="Vaucheria litorea, Strain CCMP2940" /LENGTH=146 /DNA_ID=CAMNT_0012002479 /DNA_START=29 /DNA_END=469 /DNA_ORIENTATION=-
MENKRQQWDNLLLVAVPSTFLFGGGAVYGYKRTLRSETGQLMKVNHSSNSVSFSPTRLASKAFLYGSALAVTGFGLFMASVAIALDVRSLPEFASKMEERLPSLLKKVGYVEPELFKTEKKRLENMSFEDEVKHWIEEDDLSNSKK